ncbi:MAG: hypothetical protein ACE5HE_09290, partial [Phycisphaerae bacterium]
MLLCPIRVWAVFLAVLATVKADGEIQSILGVYDAERAHFGVAFAPPPSVHRGWEFQLFIDADDDERTGYGDGFEFVVRGVEFSEPIMLSSSGDSGQIHLRHTDGISGPGGWGGSMAVLPFEVEDGTYLAFDVPLGVGPLTDGRFRYAFESYFRGRFIDGVYNRYTERGATDTEG